MNVLLACHNRAHLTVQSLEGMFASAKSAGVDVSFTVFDDGSTDGTAGLVSGLPVDLTLIRGDGSAFWARSMATAEKALMETLVPDRASYVVWLNDDVILDDDAVARLADCVLKQPGSVVVGAIRSPGSAFVSYSGLRRRGPHPLRFDRVEAADVIQGVDTFNGNLVVVPAAVAIRMGGIDGGFSHGLADIDYGLRCARMGLRIVQAPGTFGTCPRNPSPPRTTLFGEWIRFTGPKGGGNYGSLRRILRRSNKYSWWLYIEFTYILWWVRQVQQRITMRFGLGQSKDSPSTAN